MGNKTQMTNGSDESVANADVYFSSVAYRRPSTQGKSEVIFCLPFTTHVSLNVFAPLRLGSKYSQQTNIATVFA